MRKCVEFGNSVARQQAAARPEGPAVRRPGRKAGNWTSRQERAPKVRHRFCAGPSALESIRTTTHALTGWLLSAGPSALVTGTRVSFICEMSKLRRQQAAATQGASKLAHSTCLRRSRNVVLARSSPLVLAQFLEDRAQSLLFFAIFRPLTLSLRLEGAVVRFSGLPDQVR